MGIRACGLLDTHPWVCRNVGAQRDAICVRHGHGHGHGHGHEDTALVGVHLRILP